MTRLDPHTTPSHTIGTASATLHPIGSALADCATLLADIRDELPKRGRLVDLYLALVETLAMVEHSYRNADEALTQAYVTLEHAERCAREGWQPIPLHTTGNGAGG